mmetsp:Transcript_105144/g.240924  ORF Transcript_105144/g.240924 Transcript_105144/m.240924 type:complete len:521 (+) Transcript_105144:19-1581(+)
MADLAPAGAKAYNFNEVEEFDYHHSYDYLGGGLAAEIAEETLRKQELKGTFDEDKYAPPPESETTRLTIQKLAKCVHASKDPEGLEKLTKKRQATALGFEWLLEETSIGYKYYNFCKHCLEREVDVETVQAPEKKKKKGLGSGEDQGPIDTSAGEDSTTFLPGAKVELVELVGAKHLNGEVANVVAFDQKAGRYEVRIQKDGKLLKVKPTNLMYAPLDVGEEMDAKRKGVLKSNSIPVGTRVEIRGLQSETAKWLNGRKAFVIHFDNGPNGRYELRLTNGDIKKVKPANVRVELPPGWTEHWDEGQQKHYYMNPNTKKVQWDHPVANNTIASMTKTRVQTEDEKKKATEADDHFEENMRDGGDEPEEDKEDAAAETAEQPAEQQEAGDGQPAAKKRKKGGMITLESVISKVMALKEQVLEGGAAIVNLPTDKQQFVVHLEVLIAQLKEDTPEQDRGLLLKKTIEMSIGGLHWAIHAARQFCKSSYTLKAMNKFIDTLGNLETPDQLVEQAEWLVGLLKTM